MSREVISDWNKLDVIDAMADNDKMDYLSKEIMKLAGRPTCILTLDDDDKIKVFTTGRMSDWMDIEFQFEH